ncbi:hypothetical protein BST61_g4179 [Cercospora zeina]
MNDRSFSLTSQHKHPQDEMDPRTSSSSPTRSDRAVLETQRSPRRAISDGGVLLKQKRGQKDWDTMHPYKDDPSLEGDWGEETRTSLEVREAENEWDVEGAAAKRDVQVMFTVPKSRLRVVNADIERATTAAERWGKRHGDGFDGCCGVESWWVDEYDEESEWRGFGVEGNGLADADSDESFVEFGESS